MAVLAGVAKAGPASLPPPAGVRGENPSGGFSNRLKWEKLAMEERSGPRERRGRREALYSLILLNLQNPDTSSRLTSGAKFSSEMLDLTLHFYIKKFTINSVDSFSEHSFPVIESSTSFTI